MPTPTPNTPEGRPALHAFVTKDAHDDWHDFGARRAVSVSALLEKIAPRLDENAIGFDLDPANPALYPARHAQCWQALKADAGAPPITPHGEQLTLIGGA